MPRIPTALEKAADASAALTPEEARAIAKDAYIYGFPLVDNYRVLHACFVDTANPEYKGGWNAVHSTPGADDRATVGADLRAEPLVFGGPAAEDGSDCSLELIDLYTFRFARAGIRASGGEAGQVLLAGPRWQGDAPPGIKQIFHCETEFARVICRARPTNTNENVEPAPAGCTVKRLSAVLGQEPPPEPPSIDFATPVRADEERSSLAFFNVLNFVLQFCSIHPSETELMERIARLGIAADGQFHIRALAPGLIKAVHDGMDDAWDACEEVKKRLVSGELASADIFGSREHLKNNYLYRMVAALDAHGHGTPEAPRS